jgi:hypothetical protein
MRKLNIEFIRAEFAKEDYELLTKTYDNSHQKLEYICPRGHRHSITWSNWHQKKRCPCFSSTAKLNIEFVRAEFKKEGYELLTEVYEDAQQKLEYICPRGHHHSITWGHWNSKDKRRCPYCVGQGKLNIEFIRAEFAKEGYILLTEVYENNKQKLEYECPIGHKHSVSWNSWKSGARCPECFTIKMAADLRTDIEFIRSEFAKEGYILLTIVYENNTQKLEYICPMGHKHNVTWKNWNSKRKQRCPFCNNTGISKWEKTVKNFLGRSVIDYIPNDKSQLINPKTGCRLELDIWFPKLNKAIECNGLYWHSKPEIK